MLLVRLLKCSDSCEGGVGFVPCQASAQGGLTRWLPRSSRKWICCTQGTCRRAAGSGRLGPQRAFANMQSSRSLEAVGATKHGTLMNLRPNPKNVLPFATLTRKRKKQKTCVCSKFIKFCKMSWNHLFRQVKSWPGRQGPFDILGNKNARK